MTYLPRCGAGAWVSPRCGIVHKSHTGNYYLSNAVTGEMTEFGQDKCASLSALRDLGEPQESRSARIL